MSLEMKALAVALERWGDETVTGLAYRGDIDCLVTGTVVNHVLVIDEPLLFVADNRLVHA